MRKNNLKKIQAWHGNDPWHDLCYDLLAENRFFSRIVKKALVFSLDSYQPSLKINENPGSILSSCTWLTCLCRSLQNFYDILNISAALDTLLIQAQGTNDEMAIKHFLVQHCWILKQWFPLNSYKVIYSLRQTVSVTVTNIRAKSYIQLKNSIIFCWKSSNFQTAYFLQISYGKLWCFFVQQRLHHLLQRHWSSFGAVKGENELGCRRY